MNAEPTLVAGRRLGRYVLFDIIASGGMASVHFGRLIGPVGFSRTVAIKKLHPHLAQDPEFVAMFLDEARLASRVRHPNVIAALDVVTTDGEVFLVMEYVRGDSLSGLTRAARQRSAAVPPDVLSSILCGALHGLHAAHAATTERGEPLQIVHRDVSPQNLLVGDDGVARLVDFGVAKAVWRAHSTQAGQIKGKLSYMAPEQLLGASLDHRADLYALGVVLWEGLTGQRLFTGDNPVPIMQAVLSGEIPPPSTVVSGITPQLDALVLAATSRRPEARFATALEMVAELERVLPPATQAGVADWVRSMTGPARERREKRLAEIEATSDFDSMEDHVASQRSGVRMMSDAPTQTNVAATSHPLPPSAEVDQSIVSVSGTARRRSTSGRSAVVPWLGGVLLATIGIVFWLASIRGRPAPAAPNAPGAVPVVSATTESSPANAAPSAVALPDPAASAARAASEPLASRPRAQGPAAPVGRAPGASPARPATSQGAASRNCDPPYVLDPSSVSPDGQPLKRFKPWCI